MPASRPPDEFVYLDHAAATPLDPEVAAAMQDAAAAFANPSSPHAAGRAAKRILEDAREQILGVLGGRMGGAGRDRLVFTGGATEANRLGVVGLAGPASSRQLGGTVAISARDHSSLRAAAEELGSAGWRVVELPLVRAGAVDFAHACSPAASTAPRILTTTTVCGQTGIRDGAGTGNLAASGWLVHADATQGAAWDEVAFAAGPWHTLALAPHKFGGPRGIGGLVVKNGVSLTPVTPGSQELGLRGGTEAVALAAGFARAVQRAAADRVEAAARVAMLRDRLERGILAVARHAGIDALVVGANAPRAPHITLIALAGLDRQAVAMAADLAGVCLSTGTACASGSAEPPAVLAALGLPERYRRGGIRLSLARATTEPDIEQAITRLEVVFRRLGHEPRP